MRPDDRAPVRSIRIIESRPLEEPSQESRVAVAARQRQTNKLIALGAAFFILLMFVGAIAFAVADHSLSGQPLFH